MPNVRIAVCSDALVVSVRGMHRVAGAGTPRGAMNRRGFLAGIIATASAPAIVRADSLMRIVPRATTLLAPTFYNTTAEEVGRMLGEMAGDKLDAPALGGDIVSIAIDTRTGRAWYRGNGIWTMAP